MLTQLGLRSCNGDFACFPKSRSDEVEVEQSMPGRLFMQDFAHAVDFQLVLSSWWMSIRPSELLSTCVVIVASVFLGYFALYNLVENLNQGRSSHRGWTCVSARGT